MTDNVAPAGITAEFDVSEALVGMRLDAALAGALEIPRTRASGWIRDGHVRVVQRGNELKIGKSHKLSAGETVFVNAPAPRDLADIQPEKVDGFGIVYCDDDIVVVDKPAGVAAHPSHGWHGPTVLSALLGEGVTVATSGAAERQGIVHRLDVGTSGLMVVARSERAYTELKRALRIVPLRRHIIPWYKDCRILSWGLLMLLSAGIPGMNGNSPLLRMDVLLSPTMKLWNLSGLLLLLRCI